MSKIRLVALLAVLVLVLSACASAQNGDGLQTPGLEGEGFATPGLEGEGFATPGLGGEGLETPMLTEEGGVPVTGETPMATEPLATEPMATEAVTTEPAVTEEVATTEPVETESPMADGSPTVEDGTPAEGGVPVTGVAGLDDPYPNTLSEVNDFVVVDTNCEQIAGIDGYLVSVDDGQILYVVANPSGVLDLDGRVLIPWDAFEVNLDAAEMQADPSMAQTPAVGDQTAMPEGAATEGPGSGLASGQVGECPAYDAGQALRLNVGADELASVPTIPADQDVNQLISGEGWDAQFSSFWSDLGVEVNQPAAGNGAEMTQETPALGDQTASPEGGEDMTAGQVGSTVFVQSAGDLAVRNMNAEEVADVADVIIDPENGQISHLVLSVGGFLGIGDRFVPVPWDSAEFQMDGEQLVLVIDADQTRLEEAPGFESRNEFPSTEEEGWESEFDSYWQSGG